MFPTETVGPEKWHKVKKTQVTRSHKSNPVQPVMEMQSEARVTGPVRRTAGASAGRMPP